MTTHGSLLGRSRLHGVLLSEGRQSMNSGCAIRIYDDENSGLAFASPESWFVDDVTVTRFPAYTRTRSVWSLYDAMSTIPVKAPTDRSA